MRKKQKKKKKALSITGISKTHTTKKMQHLEAEIKAWTGLHSKTNYQNNSKNFSLHLFYAENWVLVCRNCILSKPFISSSFSESLLYSAPSRMAHIFNQSQHSRGRWSLQFQGQPGLGTSSKPSGVQSVKEYINFKFFCLKSF